MAVKEGMELVHWMGDEGCNSGWQVTGLRETDMRVETADYFTRKDTIGQWKKMLMKEPPKKKACKYTQAEAGAMLTAFQKGTGVRQHMGLTCYVTGQNLTHVEITRSTALRRQLVVEALIAVGVPRKIIRFTPPNTTPPCYTSREDLIGTYGEEYRRTAGQYNAEALANYKASIQDILSWAATNLPEGPGKVNKALMAAMPSILAKSIKRAREVTQAKIEFPPAAERSKMFKEADPSGTNLITLADCYKAVVAKWSDFDHVQAAQSAFKLADKDKKGCINEPEFTKFLKYLVTFNEYWFAWGKVNSRDSVRKGEWVEICPKVLGFTPDLTAAEKEQMFTDMNTSKATEVSKTAVCAYIAKVQGDSDLDALMKDPQASSADKRATWVEHARTHHWTAAKRKESTHSTARRESTHGTPVAKKDRRPSKHGK
eukprot:TRINITY_DN11704_c0_g1_i1.p1 TRINITY_DN11704_c0_g1~~TRINITY_DN11704_c0_g1_i1.p1  ORF type:complete len:429 (+),score=95.75 TRINITY_DN11704_c0_g1_i1:83-1369(+)